MFVAEKYHLFPEMLYFTKITNEKRKGFVFSTKEKNPFFVIKNKETLLNSFIDVGSLISGDHSNTLLLRFLIKN